MRRSLLLLFVLATVTANGQQPTANSPDDAFLDAMYAVRTFHSVAISPDGTKVAWAERKGGITMANADGSNARHLTTGDEEHVAWSPYSRTLAYVDGSGARKQLFVARGSESPKQLTNVSGYLAEPRCGTASRSPSSSSRTPGARGQSTRRSQH